MKCFPKKALVAGLLAVCIGAFSLPISAIWKESEAVHINPDEIPVATLAIGSHLVHLSALTDVVYDLAIESAGESGQSVIYYKSELANGTWFDITSATSLTDITTGGKPVQPDTVGALFFTHHTKADGITYDLRTNAPVNPLEIKNPYDIEAMDELIPLKNEYQMMGERGGSDEENNVRALIQNDPLLGKPERENAKKVQDQMAALQRYLNVLIQNEAGSAEIGVVQTVMEGLDAQRRTLIFAALAENLSEYLDALSKKPTKATGEEDAPDPVTTLIDATAESLQNVEESLLGWQAKQLSEGGSYLLDTLYAWQKELISHAEGDVHSSCDADVTKILHLTNIQGSVIADRPAELALLAAPLIPGATAQFTTALYTGESPAYQQAKSANAAAVLLKNLVRETTAIQDAKRSELEFLITAYCDRTDPTAAIAFLAERITLTTGCYANVPQDGTREGSIASVDAHIDFLTQLKQKLAAGLGGNPLDALQHQKNALLDQKQDALDHNDLLGAQVVENQIVALDEKLNAAEAAQNAALDEKRAEARMVGDQLADALTDGNTALAAELQGTLGKLEADIKAGEAAQAAGSLSNQLSVLKRQAFDALAVDPLGSDALADLKNATDAIIAIAETNPLTAVAALAAVQDVLPKPGDGGADETGENTGMLGEIAAAIAQAIADNADAFAAARAETDALGGDGQDGLDGLSAGDFIVFPKLREGTAGAAAGMEYLPVDAISRATGLRYIHNQSENEATLAKGGIYYTFTAGKDAVVRSLDGSLDEYLPQAAIYQSVLYLREDYVMKTFGISCTYLANSPYAVVDDPALAGLTQPQLQKLLG